MGENWSHHDVPSELFTNTVFTPYCCAWAAMPAVVPSLDLLTCQIHIPVPSNAVPLPCTARGVVRLWMWIGPTTFERSPCSPMILMRPDLAVNGTVVTKPAGRLSRSFEVSTRGEPPDAECTRRLKSTTMPCLRRLRPRKRSRPPGATVWASLQTATGQQRTEVTCGARERASAACGPTAIARTARARARASWRVVRSLKLCLVRLRG